MFVDGLSVLSREYVTIKTCRALLFGFVKMSVLKMLTVGAIAIKRTGFSGSVRSERFLKRILGVHFGIRGTTVLLALPDGDTSGNGSLSSI